MSDRRIALYVYAKETVTIAPNANVDFMLMNNDYTAKFDHTISSSETIDLYPGVYGFVYNGTHGVTAPSTVTLVDDLYDIQRKSPWPAPPPPPPPPFSGRSDWSDHLTIFLVPLGATFALGISGDGSGG